MALIIPEATSTRTAEGLYRFKLKSMTDATYNEKGEPVRLNKNGDVVHRALWVFDIEAVINGDEDSEEFVGKEHWEWTTTSRNVNSNMRKWLEALLDRPITDDEPLSDGEVVGRRCLATIGPVSNPMQAGQVSIKLANMAPFRSKRAATTAAAKQAEEPELDAESMPF